MPDYFHLTPEALTMRFYSKAQVKNSNLCDIADDNLPDNLFALKGEQLEIKEGTNTLNKDLALALGFNQIFDQNTANQVGKLIVANGPLLDPKTILYYVKRLKNGPYGYGITQHIKANFDQAKTAGNSRVPFQQNLGGGSNIDNDFVSYLQNKLGAADCFLTPANYFDFQGVYGTLANTQNIWNYTTAPAFDTNGKQTRGNEAYETASKMPKPVQMVNGVLNLATLGTYKKFLKLFKTEEELAKERANFESGTSVRESNDGESATPDILTAKSRQEASTDGLSEIAEFLGDAFRVFTFQYRANPYGYTNSPASPGNNAMIPQPAGTVGPLPVTPRSIDNDYLNLPLGNIQENSSQTYNPLLPPIPPVTVVPYSKDPTISPKTSFRENSPTYQDFINGKSSYVGIITHPNIGYSEANVTISGFERNNTVIPLKIVGYSDDSDPARVKVLVDPKTTPFESKTGSLTLEPFNQTSQTCAANQPANVTSNGEIIPPSEISPNGITLGNTGIAKLREDYKRQIETNPALREKLAILTQAEVGNVSPALQVSFIETVMNRGIATGTKNLESLITPVYYGSMRTSRYNTARQELNNITNGYAQKISYMGVVYNGSNLTNMATDAGSNNDPGRSDARTSIAYITGEDIANPNQQYYTKTQTPIPNKEFFYQKGYYKNVSALDQFTSFQ